MIAEIAIVCNEIELPGVLVIEWLNSVLANVLNQARFSRLSVIWF